MLLRQLSRKWHRERSRDKAIPRAHVQFSSCSVLRELAASFASIVDTPEGCTAIDALTPVPALFSELDRSGCAALNSTDERAFGYAPHAFDRTTLGADATAVSFVRVAAVAAGGGGDGPSHTLQGQVWYYPSQRLLLLEVYDCPFYAMECELYARSGTGGGENGGMCDMETMWRASCKPEDCETQDVQQQAAEDADDDEAPEPSATAAATAGISCVWKADEDALVGPCSDEDDDGTGVTSGSEWIARVQWAHHHAPYTHTFDDDSESEAVAWSFARHVPVGGLFPWLRVLGDVEGARHTTTTGPPKTHRVIGQASETEEDEEEKKNRFSVDRVLTVFSNGPCTQLEGDGKISPHQLRAAMDALAESVLLHRESMLSESPLGGLACYVRPKPLACRIDRSRRHNDDNHKGVGFRATCQWCYHGACDHAKLVPSATLTTWQNSVSPKLVLWSSGPHDCSVANAEFVEVLSATSVADVAHLSAKLRAMCEALWLATDVESSERAVVENRGKRGTVRHQVGRYVEVIAQRVDVRRCTVLYESVAQRVEADGSDDDDTAKTKKRLSLCRAFDVIETMFWTSRVAAVLLLNQLDKGASGVLFVRTLCRDGTDVHGARRFGLVPVTLWRRDDVTRYANASWVTVVTLTSTGPAGDVVFTLVTRSPVASTPHHDPRVFEQACALAHAEKNRFETCHLALRREFALTRRRAVLDARRRAREHRYPTESRFPFHSSRDTIRAILAAIAASTDVALDGIDEESDPLRTFDACTRAMRQFEVRVIDATRVTMERVKRRRGNYTLDRARGLASELLHLVQEYQADNLQSSPQRRRMRKDDGFMSL